MTDAAVRYLVYAEHPLSLDAIAGESYSLRPHLHLVATPLSRSRLYHAIKRELPDGTPLLVAPLADAPKFKDMAQGALNFVRRTAA